MNTLYGNNVTGREYNIVIRFLINFVKFLTRLIHFYSSYIIFGRSIVFTVKMVSVIKDLNQSKPNLTNPFDLWKYHEQDKQYFVHHSCLSKTFCAILSRLISQIISKQFGQKLIQVILARIKSITIPQLIHEVQLKPILILVLYTF